MKRRDTATRWDTVAIVGVGLIGGSVGQGLLKRRLARRVVGIGRHAGRLRVAKRVGAVTSTTTSLARGVAEADLIVVGTPVGRIVEDVSSIAKTCKPGALITDVGSTKATIVAALDRRFERDVRFLGGHPLAGGEKTGAARANPDLFVGRVAVLTPTRGSRTEDRRALAELWKGLGAQVLEMSAAEHDRLIAATSHAPHLLASLLAASTEKREQPLAATGWLDMTRLAAGDVELWKQILLDNRENVARALGRLEKQLAAARQTLERGDAARLERLLKDGKRIRDAVGN